VAPNYDYATGGSYIENAFTSRKQFIINQTSWRNTTAGSYIGPDGVHAIVPG